MGFGLVANQGDKRYDKLELELGMVGPNAVNLIINPVISYP